VEWSSYLGGNGASQGFGIAADSAGNVFVTGYTESSGWVSGDADATYNGGGDAFVAKFSNSGAPLWSTYVGGTSYDSGFGIVTDDTGNVFVTGTTASSGWVSGGLDTSYNGGTTDAFVAKISGSGAHVWSTYLGGDGADGGDRIARDGAGNVFVTGGTESAGWVSGGYDTSQNGNSDAFVVKLSGAGAHVWSTFAGGSQWDGGHDVVVDAAGNALVTGLTYSSGWAVGGFDTTANGLGDAFVLKLSATGSRLWSTFLGGDDRDEGWGIAVDKAGDAYVTGSTGSEGWVSGGFDTTYNGGGDLQGDAFVAKISGAGLHVWSTYLGGANDDWGWGIAVNGTDKVFVGGQSDSPDWVQDGFDTVQKGNYDAFVTALATDGSHLWSSYLGGSEADCGLGIALDRTGDVFLTGSTSSSGWVRDGFDSSYNGGGDSFIVKIRPRPAQARPDAWRLYR
jgi:hypothetical protein